MEPDFLAGFFDISCYQKQMIKSLLPYVIGVLSHLAPQKTGHWLATKFLTPATRHQSDPPAAARRDLKDGGVLWSMEGGSRHAILIHGWSGYRAQFDAILPVLQEHGFSIHLIDPPGHGAAVIGRSNPVRFVRAIEDAIALVGEPDLLIGHSMGGVAIMHLAVGDQKKTGKHIVAVSAPHGVRHSLNETARMVKLGTKAKSGFIDAIESETGVGTAELDILPRASQCTTPITLIHDRKDPQIPFEHALEITAAWPNASLVETSGAGHNRTLKAPETLRALEIVIEGESDRSGL